MIDQKMTAPDTQWRIIALGVLALPHTRLTIEWNGKKLPVLHYDGVAQAACANIADAKSFAQRYMAELIEAGLEP